MATKGQVIHNSSSGETIKFLLTAADTDGELLKFGDSVPANHAGVPSHIHNMLFGCVATIARLMGYRKAYQHQN